MSEFIELTGLSTGKAIFVPKKRIMGVAASDESTEVFVEGMSQGYTLIPWHVTETPEEIMAMLEGAAPIPVPASPVKASGVHLLNYYEVSREGANKGFVNYIRCSCEMEFLTDMEKHITAKEHFNAHLMAMAGLEGEVK